MGKNTDKLYITYSEWSGADGRHGASSGTTGKKVHKPFRRLPYNYCSLSLQPFRNPVCTQDGTIFDIENILSWLEKKGTNPVTGKKMDQKELMKLNFHKNEDGEYSCPVTFKVFNDHTHIVALKPTGNVFSWEAVDRLNIKAKLWRDLVTNVPFTRHDIMTIQDPHNLSNRDMSTFQHLDNGQKRDENDPLDPAKGINLAAAGSSAKIIAANEAVRALRDKSTADPNFNPASHNSKTIAKPSSTKIVSHVSKKPLPYNAAVHSTGLTAASLTSTSFSPQTFTERATLTEEEVLLKPRKIWIKGYARINTSLGAVNVELHTEYAPKAVYNFVKLAQQGYYNGIVFHRNIRNFMVQGGDPTGTGRGGTSYWGKDFADELQNPLVHDSRGIMSMANKGKNTNSSQFFITYRAMKHLDNKHTIFGKVVGGLDVLDRMEKAPTGENDRPEPDIEIKEVVVFIDPFEEFQKQRLENEEKEKREAEQKKIGREEDRTTFTGKVVGSSIKRTITSQNRSGVGKYLGDLQTAESTTSSALNIPEPLEEIFPQPVKKKARTGGFNNFDGW
ncbi:Peptidyl-prolyl cis-trans isomerase-like 2 [Neolecta irregularis DAH-3]|uniref:Peptidyl-prolyl cis-trans isomerase-like 2 n=1 Tax=Neolecta irregularis (strain DAH-3) TaxID=1198029 RepID=A0A1U7LVJ4_NEOID|nr:Peptidyl-prolyl cis-trans isomerase-like 2 [Neolecta irregularis DAH-3]|eukprot:OLL26593.1 Peptidyl-prolyl cis-trans isomerase-like 2 [Neolecta irregularis DAH-3]